MTVRPQDGCHRNGLQILPCSGPPSCCRNNAFQDNDTHGRMCLPTLAHRPLLGPRNSKDLLPKARRMTCRTRHGIPTSTPLFRRENDRGRSRRSAGSLGSGTPELVLSHTESLAWAATLVNRVVLVSWDAPSLGTPRIIANTNVSDHRYIVASLRRA